MFVFVCCCLCAVYPTFISGLQDLKTESKQQLDEEISTKLSAEA